MAIGCVSEFRFPAFGCACWSPLLMPLVLSVGNDVLFSQICIYAVIALSLTMLTGWAGQVSLGQFGLVAVGRPGGRAPRELRAAPRWSCSTAAW